MRKHANSAPGEQLPPGSAALSSQDTPNSSDQVNDASQEPELMMMQADAMAPLDVLANIYQQQAYIVEALNQNVNNIANLLEPLTNTVNMLNQWLMEHQQHEELEDRAFKLQQLIAKQQSVGYNNTRPSNPSSPIQQPAQQTMPQTEYTPQQPQQIAPNSGPAGSFANYDERGITPPRGYS
jgi:hypothetical protein